MSDKETTVIHSPLHRGESFPQKWELEKEFIPVTRPFLPPLERYHDMVARIWESQHLTNAGPMVVELEEAIRDVFRNKRFHLVGNGTIALQIAIRALDLSGEIITTPFSFVATTSSIVWERCSPVFVDIDRETFNLDPKKIEAAITEKTTAILATHVYGNPCDVHQIAEIAKRHRLKVIYDAAHAFGVDFDETPLVNYGDISTLSFHATKIFHTVEGGGLVCSNDELHEKVGYLRNFGHDGPDRFHGPGINGKNSEFHAAMGLLNLESLEEIRSARRQRCHAYDEMLFSRETTLRKPKPLPGTRSNYAYYPITFESEEQLREVIARLKRDNIHPRRYFYPSLSELDYVVRQEMPVSESIAKRVLCLPLFHNLRLETIGFISRVVLSVVDPK